MKRLLRHIFRRQIARGGYCGTNRQADDEANFTRQMQVLLDERPSPLPKRRRRLSQTSLVRYPQEGSPFFTKLPPEIREKIYEFVLGGRVIHLMERNGKATIHHIAKVNEILDCNEQAGNFVIQESPFDLWTKSSTFPPLDQTSKHLLSILKTCHAIYVEAISILYNSNIFDIASPLVLLYLHNYRLLHQRFVEIRHLNFDWEYYSDPLRHISNKCPPYDQETWISFWNLVGQMNLRTLAVHLDYTGPAHECSSQPGWTQPLMQIKGIERVGLKLERRDWLRPSSGRLPGMEESIIRQWSSL